MFVRSDRSVTIAQLSRGGIVVEVDWGTGRKDTHAAFDSIDKGCAYAKRILRIWESEVLTKRSRSEAK